jgi:hypothetical protein
MLHDILNIPFSLGERLVKGEIKIQIKKLSLLIKKIKNYS